MPAYSDPTTIPFGAQVLTIGAVTFVAENISFSQPSTVVERRDEDGDPSGQVAVAGFDNGTTTLQLATTSTVPPAIGATFTLTRNGGATVGCFISEVGEPQDQMDIRKLNVSFRRRYAS